VVEPVFLGSNDHKAVATRLRGYANDPMWANHGEVPKSLLFEAAQLLTTPPDATAQREAISRIIQSHIDRNTFQKNKDGSVEIDASGLVLTLSEALQTRALLEQEKGE
jgi:hypothetical protein